MLLADQTQDISQESEGKGAFEGFEGKLLNFLCNRNHRVLKILKKLGSDDGLECLGLIKGSDKKVAIVEIFRFQQKFFILVGSLDIEKLCFHI